MREVNLAGWGRFDLLEPLQMLHKAVLGASGLRHKMPAILLQMVTASRKAGQLPQAMNALQELQRLMSELSTRSDSPIFDTE